MCGSFGTFRNISRASDHVRTPFLDLEHLDMQPGICSPASAAWPYFRIRHPDLGSFGDPSTRPRMGTLGNLSRCTRTCPRVSSVTCARCCSSRGTCGHGGAGGAGGARGARSCLGCLCSANISTRVLIPWRISPISVANYSTLLSTTNPPVDPAAGSNSSETEFRRQVKT